MLPRVWCASHCGTSFQSHCEATCCGAGTLASGSLAGELTRPGRCQDRHDSWAAFYHLHTCSTLLVHCLLGCWMSSHVVTANPRPCSRRSRRFVTLLLEPQRLKMNSLIEHPPSSSFDCPGGSLSITPTVMVTQDRPKRRRLRC